MIMTKEQINNQLEAFYLSNKIEYNEGKHTYKLDGITCAGVSTISEYMPKPYLVMWSAKMVSEFLKDKLDTIKGMSQNQFEDLLLEAKKQHSVKSKNALDIGTRVHDWIENYIKTGEMWKIEEDMKNGVEEFLKFEKKHKVEWLAVEKIVCSPEHLVAGRIDSLSMVDGVLSLVDFKTSSQISESYYLQTQGYSMCLREMGIDIEQRIILRLPKKIGDNFQAVLVDTDPEKDEKAFLNQRYAREWANYIDCNFKEKVGYYKQLKLKEL